MLLVKKKVWTASPVTFSTDLTGLVFISALDRCPRSVRNGWRELPDPLKKVLSSTEALEHTFNFMALHSG